MKYNLFEKTNGQHYGLYVASYEDEGICKIGVSTDAMDRFKALQSYSWLNVSLEYFVFPFREGHSFSQSDNFSILKASSFGLEKAVLDKAKELGIHTRGEFIYAEPTDAVNFVKKVAKAEGYRLASPSDILSLDMSNFSRADDKAAFYEIANAAGVAIEAMRYLADKKVDESRKVI